ncbi:endonuclease/exonuclease/phosphatase family protein [Rhizobium sp. LCM 4573]|uniref:endonuclease/exonuclease/phosphatase family protein n=1 Tax=Rhizobium sp. LCM 4573 TaxID=1848291 RepID=UPI0008D9569F|nr:endonuclease/exonuclease/phosphatase family protein [Rhizobium sp. LCM 4573]OHV84339.1 hypothetical protein LCM4573_01230 [Rhizobium sp. LCM 4573]
MRETLSVAICVIVSLILFMIGTRYVTDIWLFAAFHNLQLHLALACAAALLFALVLKRGLVSVGLLCVSLLLAGHALVMSRQFAAAPTEADSDAPSFRLLSFNILRENYANGDVITQLILNSGAEVVNIMEAQPLRGHLEELSKVYPYRLGCGAETEGCDLMILSRQPLRSTVIRSLSDLFAERFMMAEVTLAGRTIHVGAIHTTKPYFDEFHTMELVRAALAITDTEGPLVLSGDFNAASIAPDMRMFLRWTGLTTAEHEPATWPVRLGSLGLPIDHVYVRPPLKIKSLTRLPDPLGSNHFGLVAEIVITGN